MNYPEKIKITNFSKSKQEYLIKSIEDMPKALFI